MALLHRALFTWFMFLVFFILLVLRLDSKVSWNWFLIFIPLWLFNTVVLIYILFNMTVHCKNGYMYDRNELSMKRKGWFLCSILLKLCFEVLLCIKLEYFSDMELYYVMVPLWILLAGGTGDVFKCLIWPKSWWTKYQHCVCWHHHYPFVMVPLWIVLAGGTGDVFKCLIWPK